MNYSKDTAFPNAHYDDVFGVTKREYFAGLAMQGILANGKYDPPRRDKLHLMAIDAVSAADALLKSLEQPKAAGE